MSNLSDCITEITERSAFWLAGSDQADTYSPDGEHSPGAEFLDSVKRAALEQWDYNPAIHEGDVYDVVADQTDSCVPIYTHSMWATFVDLGAYNEDDATDVGGDMGDMASHALRLIAERLFVRLIEELIQAREEDEAEGDDEDEEDSFDAIALDEIEETIGAENVIKCAELEEDGSCIHSDHMAAAEVAEISKLIDGNPWGQK